MVTWTLRGRTAALGRGAIINDWSAVLVERWNQPDTLQVTGTYANLWPLYQAAEGGPDKLDGGVTLNDSTGRRFSGVLSGFDEDNDTDTVTITFDSDLARLWGRDVYPDPANAWNAQSLDYDVHSGPAETVALAFITANAGTGAVAARQVTGLTVPASAGRGPTIKVTGRFDSLGQLLADIGTAAGLRFTVVQSGTSMSVQVVTCPDLTSTAKYGSSTSGGPGLLAAGAKVSVRRPDLTAALVAGGGLGAARVLRERTSSSAQSLWGRRIEQVVDQRQTSDTGELDKAGDDALAKGAQPVQIKAQIEDAEGLRLGTDVPLGALVTVNLRRRVIHDRLQQVTTTITNVQGNATVSVQGVVGSAEAGLTRDQKRFLAVNKTLRKVVAR